MGAVGFRRRDDLISVHIRIGDIAIGHNRTRRRAQILTEYKRASPCWCCLVQSVNVATQPNLNFAIATADGSAIRGSIANPQAEEVRIKRLRSRRGTDRSWRIHNIKRGTEELEMYTF